MPLNTPYRQEVMLKPLNDTVRAALYIGNAAACKVHTLMVGAVHRKMSAVDFPEKGILQGKGIMNLIITIILVDGIGRKMLVDIPTKENIDELHSLANAQHRLLSTNKGFQNGKLEPVKGRVYDTGTAV